MRSLISQCQSGAPCCFGQTKTLIIDDEEFITYFQEPVKITLTRTTFRVGDKIQYLAGNPDKISPDRIKGIVFLSCGEAAIVALLIGTTIYEIKKGF